MGKSFEGKPVSIVYRDEDIVRTKHGRYIEGDENFIIIASDSGTTEGIATRNILRIVEGSSK